MNGQKAGLACALAMTLNLLQAPIPACAAYRPQANSSPAGSVPSGVNFQGRLVDKGFPVTGTRTMTFYVYGAATGGAPLWTSTPQAVDVSQGIFGATLAISTSSLAGPGQKYLEVKVENTTLAPREPLNAVPYAMIAKSVEENLNIDNVAVGTQLISSGTLSVSILTAVDGIAGITVSSNTFFTSGKVGVGTTAPASKLHMSSGTLTLDGSSPGISVGVSTLVVTSGNVGIGTSSPAQILDVNGSARFGSSAQSLFTSAGVLQLASPLDTAYGGTGLTSAGSAGNLLVSNGTQWGSAAMSGDATISGTGGITLANSGVGANIYGSATEACVLTVDSKGRIVLASSVTISGVAPGGAAGGDLTGSYPNPTLKTSGVTAGTYGSATQVGQVIVDAKGRITSASNVAISGVAPAGAAGAGGGDLTGTYPDPSLKTSGVSAGTWGSATQVGQFTVDAKGRITVASNVTIGAAGGSAGGDLSGSYPNPSLKGTQSSSHIWSAAQTFSAGIDVTGATGISPLTLTQLRGLVPDRAGQMYYCSTCAPPKIAVSTGTASGAIADAVGGTLQ